MCETPVSCAGSRPTACDPHALGGSQCGDQRRPDLEHSELKNTEVGGVEVLGVLGCGGVVRGWVGGLVGLGARWWLVVGGGGGGPDAVRHRLQFDASMSPRTCDRGQSICLHLA